MAKSRKRAGSKERLDKRNKAIRKAQMDRVSTLTNNIDVFQQVLKEYAEERLKNEPKDHEDS
jgi:hypothetical protein